MGVKCDRCIEVGARSALIVLGIQSVRQRTCICALSLCCRALGLTARRREKTTGLSRRRSRKRPLTFELVLTLFL